MLRVSVPTTSLSLSVSDTPPPLTKDHKIPSIGIEITTRTFDFEKAFPGTESDDDASFNSKVIEIESENKNEKKISAKNKHTKPGRPKKNLKPCQNDKLSVLEDKSSLSNDKNPVNTEKQNENDVLTILNTKNTQNVINKIVKDENKVKNKIGNKSNRKENRKMFKTLREKLIEENNEQEFSFHDEIKDEKIISYTNEKKIKHKKRQKSKLSGKRNKKPQKKTSEKTRKSHSKKKLKSLAIFNQSQSLTLMKSFVSENLSSSELTYSFSDSVDSLDEENHVKEKGQSRENKTLQRKKYEENSFSGESLSTSNENSLNQSTRNIDFQLTNFRKNFRLRSKLFSQKHKGAENLNKRICTGFDENTVENPKLKIERTRNLQNPKLLNRSEMIGEYLVNLSKELNEIFENKRCKVMNFKRKMDQIENQINEMRIMNE